MDLILYDIEKTLIKKEETKCMENLTISIMSTLRMKYITLENQ